MKLKWKIVIVILIVIGIACAYKAHNKRQELTTIEDEPILIAEAPVVYTESLIQNETVAAEYAYYPNEETVLPDEAEIEMLARLVYGEARGLDAYEQSLVCFCVFNRVDDDRFPNSIGEVITQAKPCVQFDGYSHTHPITEDIHDIVVEAWNTWANELDNPLPSRFVYFRAENGHNQFYTHWNGGERFEL